jgi:arabinosaccharide transport system substrate-binding protein
MEFPFGKTAFWLLLLGVFTGGLIIHLHKDKPKRPDLVMVVFHPTHKQAYSQAIHEFESKHNVRVQVQVVDVRSLPHRLNSALLADAEIPDLVETEVTSLGYFTKGPRENWGFSDLRPFLERDKLLKSFVPSRLAALEIEGSIMGLPHDVHPVVLLYRRDILDSLGIATDSIRTWQDLIALAPQVMQHPNGASTGRYLLDLPDSGDEWLMLLLLQKDLWPVGKNQSFDMNIPQMAQVFRWYTHQVAGPTRTAFPAGWGQGFYAAIRDGLVVFTLVPDWRTKMVMQALPEMSGKLALMPLPAWEEGARRTSVMGGSCLMISRKSENQELAWKLAKAIYLNPAVKETFYQMTHVVPAYIPSWNIASLHEPSAYFADQKIGELFLNLIPETPAAYQHPYSKFIRQKLNDVLSLAIVYYRQKGDEGLTAYIMNQLKSVQATIENTIDNEIWSTVHAH